MPVGVFGMTAPLADFLADHVEGDFTDKPSVPTGGTVYANALSMAAARAGLAEVFTPDGAPSASTRSVRGCSRGCRSWSTPAACGFTIDRWGGRCQWRLTHGAHPSPATDGYGSVNEAFADARKAFLMNRGIWDAIATTGPAISFAATSDDVDAYLESSRGVPRRAAADRATVPRWDARKVKASMVWSFQ